MMARAVWAPAIFIGSLAMARPSWPAQPAENAIHYFDLDGGTNLLVGTATALCGELAGGTIERSLEIKCVNLACSAEYHMDADYLGQSVIVTPNLDILYQQQDPNKSDPEPTKRVVPLAVGSSGTIFVTMTDKLSRQSQIRAENQSTCFRSIGKKLMEVLKPYTAGSLLASLPTEDTTKYQRRVFTVDGLDKASLYVSFPREIERGKGFTVEAVLIPSQKLGPKLPLPDIQSEVEAAQRQLQAGWLKVSEEISSQGHGPALSSALPPGSASFVSSEYLSQPLVGYEGSFASAALAIKGDNMVVADLASERQHIRPLQATFWSWVVTAKESGDAILYISTSAFGKSDGDGKSGADFTLVTPIKIRVSRDWLVQSGEFVGDHIEWIAGSALIPLAVFIWGLWPRIRRRWSAPVRIQGSEENDG